MMKNIYLIGLNDQRCRSYGAGVVLLFVSYKGFVPTGLY
jgi:hypothetical protein